MQDEVIRDILVRLALDADFRAALERDPTVALATYDISADDRDAFRAGDHRMLDLLGRAQRAGGIRPSPPAPVAAVAVPSETMREADIPPPPVMSELRFVVRCAPYPFWNGTGWQVTWGVSVHPAPDESESPPIEASNPRADRRAELRDAILSASPEDRWQHIAALAAEMGNV